MSAGNLKDVLLLFLWIGLDGVLGRGGYTRLLSEESDWALVNAWGWPYRGACASGTGMDGAWFSHGSIPPLFLGEVFFYLSYSELFLVTCCLGAWIFSFKSRGFLQRLQMGYHSVHHDSPHGYCYDPFLQHAAHITG